MSFFFGLTIPFLVGARMIQTDISSPKLGVLSTSTLPRIPLIVRLSSTPPPLALLPDKFNALQVAINGVWNHFQLCTSHMTVFLSGCTYLDLLTNPIIYQVQGLTGSCPFQRHLIKVLILSFFMKLRDERYEIIMALIVKTHSK